MTKAIKAGERFLEDENFGIYRRVKDDNGYGISGFKVDVVGVSKAKRDFAPGDTIGPHDYEKTL